MQVGGIGGGFRLTLKLSDPASAHCRANACVSEGLGAFARRPGRGAEAERTPGLDQRRHGLRGGQERGCLHSPLEGRSVSWGLVKGLPYSKSRETGPSAAVRQWTEAAEEELEGPPLGEIFRRFYRGDSIGGSAMTAQHVSKVPEWRVRENSVRASRSAFNRYARGGRCLSRQPGRRHQPLTRRLDCRSWQNGSAMVYAPKEWRRGLLPLVQ